MGVQIKNISAGTYVNEFYYPKNSLVFNTSGKENEIVNIYFEGRKIFTERYDEFLDQNNNAYSSSQQVINDLLLNFVLVSNSGLATEETLLSVVEATQNISINAESVNLNTDDLEDLVTSSNTKLDSIATSASNINTKLTISTTQVQYINTDSDGASGTISAGAFKISVANIGQSDALLLGKTLPSKISVPFETNWKDTLPAITYNAQSSTLLITVVKP